MHKSSLLILLSIFLTSATVTGQDTIPFRLTPHNNLTIQVILNHSDTLNLMLHTAANSVTVIREVADDLKSITWDQETDVNSWGGSSRARLSKNNAIAIENLTWDSLSIWQTERSGPMTEGKFGLNLFQGKVVEINFDQQLLILHQDLPLKAEEYDKIRITTRDGLFFIEGSSKIGEATYPNQLLLHSGYGGTILFDDAFVASSKIGEKITILKEKNLKDSYGNTITTKRGKLPTFSLGNTTFTDLPVGFFSGTIGRQQMSVLGGDMLRRFQLIFDARREYLYLLPNAAMPIVYSDF